MMRRGVQGAGAARRHAALGGALQRLAGENQPTLGLEQARGFSGLPLAVQTSGTARGAGGRHSISGLRVTVFGSTGFVGRYVVNALGRTGSLLSLPTRCVDNHRQHLRVMGDLGQIVFWDAPHDMIRSDEAIRCAARNPAWPCRLRSHPGAQRALGALRARSAAQRPQHHGAHAWPTPWQRPAASPPRASIFGRAGLRVLTLRAPGPRRKAIGDSNVVINLLGREVETGHYSFADVNVDAARRIAEASAAAGVTRLVHFSAMGASADAPSANLRTKAAGEAAVKAAFPNATIMRPAPIFGTEDRLLRSWAACSKLLPAVPLIDGGATRMAPVEVRDVAAAVTAVVENDELAGRTYTLAGPKEYTVKELVEMVFKTIREPVRTLPVPMSIALFAAKPRDVLQSMVPFPVPVLPAAMYTSDAIKGFGVDYVMPPGEPGFAELGIAAPRKAEGINIDYLRAFRAGGYAYGETAGQENA